MHPAVPITVAIVHAQELVRLGMRHIFPETGPVRIVLEMDGTERLRSSWPAESVQVAVLHLGQEVALLLEAIRWLMRHPLPPAVLVVGDLTPRLGYRMVEAGVRALLHSNALGAEVEKAVVLLASGGIYANGQWDAQRRAPRTSADSGSAKGRHKLTDRLWEVLRLLCDPDELSYDAIGERLGIKASTVVHHRNELFRIFDKHSRHGLVCAAFAGGYVGKRQG